MLQQVCVLDHQSFASPPSQERDFLSIKKCQKLYFWAIHSESEKEVSDLFGARFCPLGPEK